MKPLLRLFLLTLAVSPALADWPHMRGPAYDGRAVAPGTFDAEEIGLEVGWAIDLGSGYSGIAVADGRAVTLFSQGESDWVGAFDAETGNEIWRHALGELYKGYDGSDDGPLSSPVIGGDRVFALSATGRLVALGLDDGKVKWEKELAEAYGAAKPHFGFTSTPLIDEQVLILQAGGADGKSIVGINARNGKALWSHGDDSVDYQSPALMTLGGKAQVVAVGKQKIVGLNAKNGKLLWEQALGEDDRASSANPTFIGDGRFLVSMSGQMVAYQVQGAGEEYRVEELYRSDALGRSYAPPVYHDGHVYGFRGQVLTCMKAEDGERVWRSRPPGGDGLILVDDHLVIFASKGNVVIAEASPEAYKERARVQALEGSSLTWPAFADGRIFVRNLDRMAAVEISRGEAARAETSRTMHTFGRWIENVRASDEPAKLVGQFMERHQHLPAIEGDHVHFVYYGEAEDVSIAGSMIGSEQVEAMERVPGTNFFYKSFKVEPATRWEYHFQIDFDKFVPDPRNPRTVPAVEGGDTLSELVINGYAMGRHFEKPAEPKGKLETFELESEILGYGKEITVWLPGGYADGEARYPLLIVNDGSAWLERGNLVHVLEHITGKVVRPVVVTFVPADRRWWLESGGTRTDEYVRMQVEELIPALKERYRLAEGAGAHAVMGNRFYALSSIYAALKYPQVFGQAGLMSAYTGLGAGDAVEEMLGSVDRNAVRFYLDWNRYDERNVDRGYDFADHSRELWDRLQAAGFSVAGGEVLDSFGWGGWRNRSHRVLGALFPVE